MRPGAAVRLRGTWIDEVKETPDQDSALKGESLDDGFEHKASHTPESTPVHSTTTITSSTEPLGESFEASKATTAELQVTDVEILGTSDPQVRSYVAS